MVVKVVQVIAFARNATNAKRNAGMTESKSPTDSKSLARAIVPSGAGDENRSKIYFQQIETAK